MNAVVEIESLELEGMTPDEGRRAGAAFADTLTRLLRMHGLPEGKTREDIEAVDLGELPRTMQTPEGVGEELAKAVFEELWR
jgi:hypothetical protein